MKKTLIIVNSVLGFSSIYCLIYYLWTFILHINDSYYYKISKIFHGGNELLLLISMLILHILVNIFIYLVAIFKKLKGCLYEKDI